jgi:hypothetical protein
LINVENANNDKKFKNEVLCEFMIKFILIVWWRDK